MEAATLRGISSGWFEGRFSLDNETREEAVEWQASTPFVGLDKRHGPELDARYEVAGIYNGDVNRGSGRIVVLPDRVLLRHDGLGSVLEEPVFTVRDAGCARSLEAIHIGRLIDHPSSKPVPTGETTFVEAKLNLPAFLAALDRTLGGTACGDLLRQAGVSFGALKGLEAEVEDNFDKSEATFGIRSDHVLQSVSLGIWIRSSPPGAEEVDGILEIDLSRLDEPGIAIGDSAVQQAKSQHAVLSGRQQQSLKAGAALIHSLLRALGAGENGGRG